MNDLTCDDVRDLAPAYALGALERDVEQAVAEHLRSCPDVHAEIAELGSVVGYLAETVELVEPPASLRDRIRSAAAEDLAARNASATAEPTTPAAVAARPPSQPGSSSASVVSLDAARARRRDLGTWALGLAAVLAIVALGAWNVATQQDLSAARSYQARLAAALALAGQPGSQVAVLASTGAPGSGPGGIAVLPSSGNGSLVVSGLAPTSGSQVYEAWAISEGKPPTPVAGFTVGSDGIGYTDQMPTATGETLTVAITLEPKPNPTAPSSAPIAAGVATPPNASG